MPHNCTKKLLEEVFKLSGVPEYTFVRPAEYTRLYVALRTPGRGIVIEGPSGIGKTTCVEQVISKLTPDKKITLLHARNTEDKEYIEAIDDLGNLGTVVIDDFHVLGNPIKKRVADLMKYLADREHTDSKIVIVGINKVGDSLLRFEHDLAARIERISFATNSDDKVNELIEKGDKALNIKIACKKDIIKEAMGSFNIAQMLCRRICEHEEIIEEQEKRFNINTSIEVVREKILEELSDSFYEPAKIFAKGPRLIRGGRAPYLHLLRLLGESDEWSLEVEQVIIDHPELRQSIVPIIRNDSLSKHIKKYSMIRKIIHYDAHTRTISVENPKLIYYLRHLLWSKFGQKVGYQTFDHEIEYDFALSFAHTGRKFAQLLFEKLQKLQLSVFYDYNEQSRILSRNVEDYLSPIYQSEARYIVPIITKGYPESIWTIFESEKFKKRFADESVVPIWFSNVNKEKFEASYQVGGLSFNPKPKESWEQRIEKIAAILQKMLTERIMESQRLYEKAIPIKALFSQSNYPLNLKGKVIKIDKNNYGKVLEISGNKIRMIDYRSNKMKDYLLSVIEENLSR